MLKQTRLKAAPSSAKLSKAKDKSVKAMDLRILPLESSLLIKHKPINSTLNLRKLKSTGVKDNINNLEANSNKAKRHKAKGHKVKIKLLNFHF
jgi:hypothetical protein